MKYDDIIKLPHYHDSKRGYMSNRDRAAQFMPFKSLKGYSEMVDDKSDKIMGGEWEKIIYDESYDHSDRGRDLFQDGDDDGWRYEEK